MATTNLPEIVRRVRALRVLSLSTGFSTNRTIGHMLEKLTEDELVKVGEHLIRLNETTTTNR